MKLLKKFLISSILVLSCAFTFAQEEVETSVESDYLNNMIGETIKTMAKSPDLATKIEAVTYLRNAIESGNTSPAIIESLDQLAGEGITKQTRENGRVQNNFPEIRREACLILGQVPTEHSKNLLIQIAKEDKEPMVGAAAVKSLGDIAIEIDMVDEAIDAISFFQKSNMVMNPTSSYAMEVLFAYEKLIDHANPQMKKKIIEDITEIMNNPSYHNNLVQKKGMQLLMEYGGIGSIKSDKNANVSEK